MVIKLVLYRVCRIILSVFSFISSKFHNKGSIYLLKKLTLPKLFYVFFQKKFKFDTLNK